MTKQNVSNDIDTIIPKSLDDIIREHKDQLQLKSATQADLERIEKSFTVTNLRGTLTEAFIYNRISPKVENPILCLVGFNEYGEAFHTSQLVGFDSNKNSVLTASGSNYVISSYKSDEPESLLLIHICYMLHRDGLGEVFGVPKFWY